MHGITVQELWPARPPRRLFAHPTGTRAARRRLVRATLRRTRGRRAEIAMSTRDESRASTAGDRAVAIAGFLAILLTGFFGDDPDIRSQPAPAPRTVQSAPR